MKRLKRSTFWKARKRSKKNLREDALMAKKSKKGKQTPEQEKEQLDRSIRDKIKDYLQTLIKEDSELDWCVRCEAILDEVLEGIVMRKEELENLEKECLDCEGNGS